MDKTFQFDKGCGLKIEGFKSKEEIERFVENLENSKTKTILFEKKFGVDIKDFKSMADIDEFVEDRTGKKLEVSDIRSPLVGGHSPFKHRRHDIDKLFEESFRD